MYGVPPLVHINISPDLKVLARNWGGRRIFTNLIQEIIFLTLNGLELNPIVNIYFGMSFYTIEKYILDSIIFFLSTFILKSLLYYQLSENVHCFAIHFRFNPTPTEVGLKFWIAV